MELDLIQISNQGLVKKDITRFTHLTLRRNQLKSSNLMDLVSLRLQLVDFLRPLLPKTKSQSGVRVTLESSKLHRNSIWIKLASQTAKLASSNMNQQHLRLTRTEKFMLGVIIHSGSLAMVTQETGNSQLKSKLSKEKPLRSYQLVIPFWSCQAKMFHQQSKRQRKPKKEQENS